MKTHPIILIAGALVALIISSHASAQVPINDNCANAKAVTVGLTTGSTAEATLDGDSSCDRAVPGPDVWFRFTALADGDYDFNTCGSTFDTMISLHTGCPGTEANEINCNDDNFGLSCDSNNSEVIHRMNAGQIVYVRVFGFTSGNKGDFNLNIGAPPAVTNDDCVDATQVTQGSFYQVYTGNATRDGLSLGCPTNNVAPDVWFKYTPSFDRIARFRTCYGDFPAALMVYSGCPGNTTNELGCNDNTASEGCGANGNSQLYLPVEADVTYYIRVTGFLDWKGYCRFIVDEDAPTQQNVCASAEYVTYGDFTGTTAGNTADGQASCALNVAPDIWYRFLASEDALVNFSTCGSALNTSISVHTGCPGSNANSIACNSNSGGPSCDGTPQGEVTIPVAAGESYYVRVTGSTAGATGAYELHIHPVRGLVVPANNCALAPVIGLGTYSGTLAGATRDGATQCEESSFNDVWYRFIAPITGMVDFNGCGSASPITLSLHSACPGGIGNQLICAGDSVGPLCFSSTSGEFQYAVTAGASYMIRVGAEGVNGSFTLNIQRVKTPPNDGCSGVPQLDFGTYTGNSLGATPSGALSACGSLDPADLFFYVRRAEVTEFTINSCGSAYDTTLSVHQTEVCPLTLATELTCSDDGACGDDAEVTFTAQPNIAYVIRLSGFANTAGNYVINVLHSYDGRQFGDFDSSHCTDIVDFLFLLDNWTLISPIGPPEISITDFLSLLDNWQLGTSC